MEDVVRKVEKPLICQDPKLVAHTNIDIDESGPFPSLIFNENLYPVDDPVLLLYYPGNDGKPKKLYLKHKDINRELEFVNKFWNLNENSSILHSLSLYNPYGIIDSLLGPLSAGGRVVLLPQFDTTKVSKKDALFFSGIAISQELVHRFEKFKVLNQLAFNSGQNLFS